MDISSLTQRSAGGGVIGCQNDIWRLQIPPGAAKPYRLAQLDDYQSLARQNFAWQASVQMQLQARVSHQSISGTWGFGWWNDPYSLTFGLPGAGHRLPVLPNAAWYFFGSPPNYLSFDDQQPAFGWMASVFRGKPLSKAAIIASGFSLPLLATYSGSNFLRRLANRWIQHQATPLSMDPTQWHSYSLTWKPSEVIFEVDGVSKTIPLAPRGKLGIVIWIDNQFAAWEQNHSPKFGTLPAKDASWLEIRELSVTSQTAETVSET